MRVLLNFTGHVLKQNTVPIKRLSSQIGIAKKWYLGFVYKPLSKKKY
jgi:hypothetical protein